MRDIWFLITDHKGIVKILAILIAIFCVVSIGVSSYTSTMKVQEQQEQQAKKKEKEKQIKNSSVKLKKDQQKTIDEYDDATAQFSALLSSNVWATYSGTGRTLYFTDSSIIIADATICYGCVLTASVCATWIRRNKKLWSIFLQELLSDMSCRRNYSFCNGTFPKPAFRL